MSRRARVTWDSRGIEQWLKQALRANTRATAEAVGATAQAALDARHASRVRAPSDEPLQVSVEHYETDRPHSVVMVHFGAAVEAKTGLLAASATGHGLDVGEATARQKARAVRGGAA